VTKAGGSESVKELNKAAAPKRDLKITIYSYTYKLPAKPFELPPEESRSGRSTDIPD
jgi:hypothetical protein